MEWIRTFGGLVISLLISLVGVYLIAYLKEKAKNKVLLGKNKRLIGEQEEIKLTYKLEIEKRKYKSKKEQSIKYCNLIDELGKSSNEDLYEKFSPIISNYFRDSLLAENDKAKKIEAISTFSSAVNLIFADASKNLIRLRNETSSIKLIAGSKVRGLLDQIEELYDISMKKGELMMNEMAANVICDNTEIMNLQSQEIQILGVKIKDLHVKLLSEIRQELDEI